MFHCAYNLQVFFSHYGLKTKAYKLSENFDTKRFFLLVALASVFVRLDQLRSAVSLKEFSLGKYNKAVVRFFSSFVFRSIRRLPKVCISFWEMFKRTLASKKFHFL